MGDYATLHNVEMIDPSISSSVQCCDLAYDDGMGIHGHYFVAELLNSHRYFCYMCVEALSVVEIVSDNKMTWNTNPHPAIIIFYFLWDDQNMLWFIQSKFLTRYISLYTFLGIRNCHWWRAHFIYNFKNWFIGRCEPEQVSLSLVRHLLQQDF